MHRVYSLLVQLAIEFERRQSWFGASYAQTCVYLYQELIEPDLGLEFQWYANSVYSFGVEEALEFLRCGGHLEWEAEPDVAGPSYEATEYSKKWLDQNFAQECGELVRGVVSAVVDCEPNIRRILSPVAYSRKREGKLWVAEMLARFPGRKEQEFYQADKWLESARESLCPVLA